MEDESMAGRIVAKTVSAAKGRTSEAVAIRAGELYRANEGAILRAWDAHLEPDDSDVMEGLRLGTALSVIRSKAETEEATVQALASEAMRIVIEECEVSGFIDDEQDPLARAIHLLAAIVRKAKVQH